MFPLTIGHSGIEYGDIHILKKGHYQTIFEPHRRLDWSWTPSMGRPTPLAEMMGPVGSACGHHTLEAMGISYYTASSLDGFLATEDHSLDWLFEQDFDPEGPMAYPSFIAEAGAIVMGANTYQWIMDHQDEWSYEQPTWVFTHRELYIPDGASVWATDDDVEAVGKAAIQAADGRTVWLVGGGDLAGQFADAGLLDEIWVQFAPVTLGQGKPLMTRDLRLELMESAANRSFVCTRYKVLSTRESSKD